MAKKKRPRRGRVKPGKAQNLAQRSAQSPEPGVTQGMTPGSDPDSDYYFKALTANWDKVLLMFKRFEDKKPIVLYDIQEEVVYAYPYLEFRAAVSPRSQLLMDGLREKATRDGRFVVYVRDNVKRRLVSFTVSEQRPGEIAAGGDGESQQS